MKTTVDATGSRFAAEKHLMGVRDISSCRGFSWTERVSIMNNFSFAMCDYLGEWLAHPIRFLGFGLVDCSHVLKEQLLGRIDIISTNAHSFTWSLRFVQAPTLIRSAHSLAMYPSEDEF